MTVAIVIIAIDCGMKMFWPKFSSVNFLHARLLTTNALDHEFNSCSQCCFVRKVFQKRDRSYSFTCHAIAHAGRTSFPATPTISHSSVGWIYRSEIKSISNKYTLLTNAHTLTRSHTHTLTSHSPCLIYRSPAEYPCPPIAHPK